MVKTKPTLQERYNKSLEAQLDAEDNRQMAVRFISRAFLFCFAATWIIGGGVFVVAWLFSL